MPHPIYLLALGVLGLLVTSVVIALRTERGLARRRAFDAPVLAPAPAPDATGIHPAVTMAGKAPTCRFCGARAEYRKPVVVHARPALDGLLRRLGATPEVRRQLSLEPTDLSAPVELCLSHRERARSLLETQIAEASVRQARQGDETTRALIAFERTELYARMEADAVADSRRRPRARGTANAPASVVSIRRAANGGDGET